MSEKKCSGNVIENCNNVSVVLTILFFAKFSILTTNALIDKYRVIVNHVQKILTVDISPYILTFEKNPSTTQMDGDYDSHSLSWQAKCLLKDKHKFFNKCKFDSFRYKISPKNVSRAPWKLYRCCKKSSQTVWKLIDSSKFIILVYERKTSVNKIGNLTWIARLYSKKSVRISFSFQLDFQYLFYFTLTKQQK